MDHACLICQGSRLQPIEFAPGWYRCDDCRSDTNIGDLNQSPYSWEEFSHRWKPEDVTMFRNELNTNISLFELHRPERGDFLDVGCCEGFALNRMQWLGWSVHGFDVFEPPYMGPHVTVAPELKAELFPQQYHAVLCREVIEHVPDPRTFFQELAKLTAPGGLLQVQTPRPWHEFHPIPYQNRHTCLISHRKLQEWAVSCGLEITEVRRWDFGQIVLAQAPS